MIDCAKKMNGEIGNDRLCKKVNGGIGNDR